MFPALDVRYRGETVALLATPLDDVSGPPGTATESLVTVNAEPANSYSTLAELDSAGLLPAHTLTCEQYGDRAGTEAALTAAATVSSNSYEFPAVPHDYLEPDWVACEFDRQRLVIITPTQAPFELRRLLSGVLAMPADAIVIRGTRPGGGFGGRLQPLIAAQAAVAAKRLSASVRYELSHTDTNLYGPRSNRLRGQVALGVDRNGRFVALRLLVDVDAGAYSSYGPGVAKRIAVHAAGAYRVACCYVRVRLCWTNSPPAAAFRGFGVGPLTVMLEDQIRAVADRIGRDELELRQDNVVCRGGRLANGQLVDFPFEARACLARAVAARRRIRAEVRGSELTGTGVSLFLYGIGNTGQANPAVVELRHLAGTRFMLSTSTVEMGQGSHRSLRILCARWLDIPVGHIALHCGSTDEVPDSGKTSASRTVHFVGEAVRDAVSQLRAEAVASARRLLGWEHAVWSGGRVRAHGSDEPSITLDALRPGGTALAVRGVYAPRLDASASRFYPTYSVGATVASVLLDGATGRLTVERIFAVHDVGPLVDEAGATGQIVGGAAMGLGIALVDRTSGGPSSTGPSTVTAGDVPPVDVEFVAAATPEEAAKGLGEPALLGVPAAVHSAYRSIVERHPEAGRWGPHPVQRWLRSP
nr:molybdopterin cofactor-binding domain-containing protein [Micromonospora sp. DSM 115978]